jgi:hypothetical protein
MLLNGLLREGNKSRKLLLHLRFRAFEIYTSPLMAEFIAQPGVDRLHDNVLASFLLSFAFDGRCGVSRTPGS